jgi:hypothetical protein
VTKASNFNITHNCFDSALSSHIFENSSHTIVFENTSLIRIDLDIKQIFQEAIEIKLKFNNRPNASLN